MRALIAILIVLGSMAWLSPFASRGGPKVVVADGFMSAESKDHYFEFDLKERRKEDLYLLDLTPVIGGLKKMGFDYQAAFITPQNHHEFLSIMSSGRCPAGFLNQHSKILILASGDKEIKAVLNKLKGRHHSPLRIQLEGRSLTFAMGEIKGHRMDSFPIRGASPLLVEGLWQE